MMAAHIGKDDLLDSVYGIKCWSLPETPSYTHSETEFTSSLRIPQPVKLIHIISHYRVTISLRLLSQSTY